MWLKTCDRALPATPPGSWPLLCLSWVNHKHVKKVIATGPSFWRLGNWGTRWCVWSVRHCQDSLWSISSAHSAAHHQLLFGQSVAKDSMIDSSALWICRSPVWMVCLLLLLYERCFFSLKLLNIHSCFRISHCIELQLLLLYCT